MARARNRASVDIWPGFVDALAALLVVIIFLLVVFVLAQVFLAQALSGRDEALERLTTQVNELGQLLSLERESNANLRLNVAQLSASLQQANAERDELVLRLGEARDQAQELTAALSAQQARAETRKPFWPRLNRQSTSTANRSACSWRRSKVCAATSKPWPKCATIWSCGSAN